MVQAGADGVTRGFLALGEDSIEQGIETGQKRAPDLVAFQLIEGSIATALEAWRPGRTEVDTHTACGLVRTGLDGGDVDAVPGQEGLEVAAGLVIPDPAEQESVGSATAGMQSKIGRRSTGMTTIIVNIPKQLA